MSYVARKQITASGLASLNGLAASIQNFAVLNQGGAPFQLSISSVGSTHTFIAGITTIPINYGGTGQTTASAGFNALSPLTTKGDLLAFGTSSTRFPVGSNAQYLVADSTQPLGLRWASLSIPEAYEPPVAVKGDLFGFSDAPARIPVGTNGQILYADSTQALGVRWGAPPDVPATDNRFISVVRTSDLSRNTTTTPTDDPQLTTSLEANAYYRLQVVLTHNCTSAGINFKCGFNCPSGTTMGWSGTTTGGALSAANTTTATGSGSNTMLILSGWIYTSATPGTFTLQWSQGTSSASNATLLKGSCLSLEKLA